VAMTSKQSKNRKQNAYRGKGSTVPKTSQTGRKRVAVWFLGLATVAITSFVTANFTNLGNVTSSFIGSLFSSIGPPVRINLVRVVQLPRNGDSHVFANALVLSDTELSQLNSLNQTDPGDQAWFANRHAVDISATGTELVVEGSRNHTVRITDIRPIVSCQLPLKGALFYSPPAGADMSTQLLFDLDSPHAPPSYIVNQNGTTTSGKDFFGTYTVSLNQGEQHTFKIVASTAKHFCKFTLTMTVLDEDKTVTETITNDGQPFQVTARLDNGSSNGFEKPGEFSAYQVLYIGGVAIGSHGLWQRANPNTYCDC